jgi:Ca2+-binding EF-hand superfamily protein
MCSCVDVNNTRKIQSNQFPTVMRALGHRINDTMVLELDPQNTGVITWDVFLSFMTRFLTTPDTPEVDDFEVRFLNDCYRCDADNSGYVTERELTHILEHLDLPSAEVPEFLENIRNCQHFVRDINRPLINDDHKWNYNEVLRLAYMA